MKHIRILTAIALVLGVLSVPCGVTAQDVWEINIASYAKQPIVLKSMKEFSEAFKTFREENGLAAAEGPNPVLGLKAKLAEYYQAQFAVEYARKNNGRKPDLDRMFGMLDDDSIALQFFYIRANKNPLGSKHLLDKAVDKSRWTAYHAEAHPRLREYLDYFGLYDIFLVDAKTGDVVYTVYKELDFTTNLNDGQYADTMLGKVFKAVKESKDPGFTYASEMEPYAPSYEAPARFVGAPIYDGKRKIGVIIFQLPTGI